MTCIRFISPSRAASPGMNPIVARIKRSSAIIPMRYRLVKTIASNDDGPEPKDETDGSVFRLMIAGALHEFSSYHYIDIGRLASGETLRNHRRVPTGHDLEEPQRDGIWRSLVPIDAAVRMIMLPVEPVVFQCIDPREALSLHLARNGATVKVPPAEGRVIYERPRITRVRDTVAVELRFSPSDLAGKHPH